MATILLSAAGAALGASMGGSALGMSLLVVGRAIGAMAGRAIDQHLLGGGSEPIETGRIDRFRVTGTGEGQPVPRMFGRMRVSGHVIWASRFLETARTTGGGKGAPSTPSVTSYSYSVSLAVALCEGEILRVGRVWADGTLIETQTLNMRVYHGSEGQLPDPKIEAVEGIGNVPAYRGMAYVVFEDLVLEPFGNRIPQLSFEVVRAAQPGGEAIHDTVTFGTRGVALIPGTGEYALATTPVYGAAGGRGTLGALNLHAPGGGTDFRISLDALREEMPNCGSVSLIVSWFGNDLRAMHCQIKPKVEQSQVDGAGMPWTVSGLTRATAEIIAQQDGRPVYGGTPTDQSVIEAIQAIRAAGQEVMFYPFLLMEVLPGGGKPDPWGSSEQAAFPWRGRITLEHAPGRQGTSDRTAVAAAEVASFFGIATAAQFTATGQTVGYTGPDEWSYRRFILHYAHLCMAAGGVDAFCIGSEMRSLTQIRSEADGFPAVEQMRNLLAEVRSVLGSDTKISYAADWSEYFGYHPQDETGDVFFHLDPFWADQNCDFIGIDNYMPLSDWRDGVDHADADWGSIYSLDYLKANIAGGEGFDWYYAHESARGAQIRTPIADVGYSEDWVFRYKDLKSWWSLPHHPRIGGIRQMAKTDWEPRSKPIRFTELGCAAVDKGTNQPNVFLDPKSSESAAPFFSNGQRDDLIQHRYFQAMYQFWTDPQQNPHSEIYDGPMVDMEYAHVWAWDARPYPYFPADRDLWSDGGNHARGHWISGRSAFQDLAHVVSELIIKAGLDEPDTQKLFGMVRGYAIASTETARMTMQPLMLAYGFDAFDREGRFHCRTRNGQVDHVLDEAYLVSRKDTDGPTLTRLPNAETSGRVRVGFVEADGSFGKSVAEAAFSDDPSLSVSQSDLPVSMSVGEARALAQRWLAEARVARDRIALTVPPSMQRVGPGDVIEFSTAATRALYRVDRIVRNGANDIEAVRIETGVYMPVDLGERDPRPELFEAPVPVFALFLELPLLTGDEVAHAPHVAAIASSWPGVVAVYSSSQDAGYTLNTKIEAQATIGVTETPLDRAVPGIWARDQSVTIRMLAGALSSASEIDVLNGANALAIGAGDDGDWEILQFRDATLVASGTYRLEGLLRGQLGTDGVMPESWPEGSYAVLLDSALQQIDLPVSARGLARHYRTGPASRSYDDPTFQHDVLAFSGVGLRPYRPAHLIAKRQPDGGYSFNWIRRTRADGDSWLGPDVPLGEDDERYLFRVLNGAAVVREVEVTQTQWTYSASDVALDGIAPGFSVAVAQISVRYGPGSFTEVMLDV